ncbi:MAG: glycosyltransferase family 2 protein [Bryobacteraceae bacterium]
MSVSVVIPNWNGGRRLETLLKQLPLQTSPIEEIIVVDNGSEDGSPEIALSLGARVIRFDRNKGFTAAVNRGVQECTSPFVAILNNDVCLQSDWLERLVAQLEVPGVWFAAGKLLSAGRRDFIDGSFDAISRSGCSWRCGHGRPDGPIWNQPRTIFFPPFTALLMKTELFRRIGGLDERLESYLEDVDFGLRGAAKGYNGVYVPGAVAYHEGSATLGPWNQRTVHQIARNQLLLVAKHYPIGFVWKFGWPIAVGQLLWGLIAMRHGAGSAFVRGKMEGLRMFRQMRGPGDNAIPRILLESERQLRELQRQTGFDWYWRIYFALS